jgi:hypothetical protein
MPPDGGGKFPRLSFAKEVGVTENIPHNRTVKQTNHLQVARIAISPGCL